MALSSEDLLGMSEEQLNKASGFCFPETDPDATMNPEDIFQAEKIRRLMQETKETGPE